MGDNQGKGWHGDSRGHAQAGSQSSGHTSDPEEHAMAGKKGGQTTSSTHGEEFYEQIGSKGGQKAQQSGNAHELTDKERSEGGSHSGGNFKNDPLRASEAGKKGGSR